MIIVIFSYIQSKQQVILLVLDLKGLLFLLLSIISQDFYWDYKTQEYQIRSKIIKIKYDYHVIPDSTIHSRWMRQFFLKWIWFIFARNGWNENGNVVSYHMQYFWKPFVTYRVKHIFFVPKRYILECVLDEK